MPCGKSRVLRAFGQQRAGGREEHAADGRGEDDDGRHEPSGVGPGQQHAGQGHAGETGAQRHQAAAAVGEPPDDRTHHRLDGRGHEEDPGDGGCGDGQIAEPQRHEHPVGAEEERRQRREPRSEQNATIAQGPPQVAVRGWFTPGRGQRHGDREPRRHERDRREDVRRSERDGQGAEHGSPDGAGDPGAQRRADELPPPLAGGDLDEPGETGGPGRGTADALHEAGRREHRERRAEAEGDAGRAHQGEADEEGRPRAAVRGQPARGQRQQERAECVGAAEDAGLGLAETQVLGVRRQQRRDRRVEQHVEQHDRADENDDPAHVRRA